MGEEGISEKPYGLSALACNRKRGGREKVEMTNEFNFHWCRDAARARRLARLFSDNLTSSYISHSELQGRRAISPDQWVGNLAEVIEADLLGRIVNPLDAAPGEMTTLTAHLTENGTDIAVFLVTFSRTAHHPYAILEDMMVDPKVRSHGHGSRFLRWIEAECARRGISRMFLESGITNDHAHHFFEREGFKKVSVVMMRDF